MRYSVLFAIAFLFNLAIFSSTHIFAADDSDSTFRSIQVMDNKANKMEALIGYIKNVENKRPALGLAIAKEMLATATEQKLDSNLLKSYAALGKSYFILNDFANALKHYQLMLGMAAKLKDYNSQIEANLEMAYIFKTTGESGKSPEDWENARLFTERALNISRQYNITGRECDILNSLGIQYDLQKLHKKAIQTFKDAIAVARKNSQPENEMVSLMNLGICLKNNNQLEESLEVYKGAAYLADSLKLDYEKTTITNNLANLYFVMGKYDLAERTALNVIAKSIELNIDPVRLDMYDLLIKLYSKQKRFEGALVYSANFSALKDSIFSTDKSAQLKELQAKYETDIKDKTIGTQTAQIAFNKKQSLFLWAGVGLLLAIAAVIFVSQRRTSRLYKQITAQRHELLEQKIELEKVNDIKDRLFSVVSHDMRTPVNALISFTQLLQNGNVPPAKLALYAASLNLTLNHTSALMENLLNWAATQMQGFSPIVEQVNLQQMIGETLDAAQSQAAEKRISIINNVFAGTTAMADANMLRLVLRNLVANAIKYTPREGAVTLTALQSDKKTSISIADNGVGMSASMMALFNKPGMQQVESTPGTNREKGTGLGLMLCKTFVELMKGTIVVKPNESGGCSFTITV